MSLVSLSLRTPTTWLALKLWEWKEPVFGDFKGRVVVGCAESFPQSGLEASLRGQKRKAGCLCGPPWEAVGKSQLLLLGQPS